MNDKIASLVSQMTLEEKAGLCSGKDFWTTKAVERLGIPSIMMTDGPHGLRKQAAASDHLGLNQSVPATCFPSAAGLASTWNRLLVRQVGEALGRETKANDVAVILGPGVNIKRSPLCGRNFEYMSEDPFLAGELAVQHIQGVQSQGVGTSLKHYAANNQEKNRMTVDTLVDERTLREIYLPAFEKAVKQAQPWTVMCSYNKLNGTFASEHPWLLTKVLKEEWGHEGIVVTDWGACNDRVAGLAAGQELEMPASGGATDAQIVAAVKAGKLDVKVLDAAVTRVLKMTLTAVANRDPKATYDVQAHHALARKVAAEAAVLLKNDGNLLPLTKEGRVAFIGAFAETPRYQGGGSSHINPTRLDSALAEARAMAGPRCEVGYAPGYHMTSDATDPKLLAEAVALAAKADVAVLFVGLTDRFESEGFDRTHLGMPEAHRTLVEEISLVQPNLVVVLSNGSPIEMPWADEVPAIVEAYLGGQAWGGAIADVLFGAVNPSGKLAETFPLRLADTPAFLNFPGDGTAVEYREGIHVGYRYYEAKDQDVLWPFGHGLSYTTFTYSGLKVSADRITDKDTLTVEVTVTNTGSVAGQEVVQLYVRDVAASVIRPLKELKGFDKVSIAPGASATVKFVLDSRAFAFWHPRLGGWKVEAGDFEILVGASSADVRLKTKVAMEAPAFIDRPWDRNTRLGDLLGHPALGGFARSMLAGLKKGFGADGDPNSPEALMMEAMINELPLRSIVSFAQGAFTVEAMDLIIDVLNGRKEPSALKALG